jgi:hypothetical protein
MPNYSFCCCLYGCEIWPDHSKRRTYIEEIYEQDAEWNVLIQEGLNNRKLGKIV